MKRNREKMERLRIYRKITKTCRERKWKGGIVKKIENGNGM